METQEALAAAPPPRRPGGAAPLHYSLFTLTFFASKA